MPPMHARSSGKPLLLASVARPTVDPGPVALRPYITVGLPFSARAETRA